jgi:hypothetical protein
MMHSILIGVNTINLVILSLLIYVYVKNYRRIKSKFNLGLLLFSSLFFIENALILHLGLFQWPALISGIVVVHLALVNAIQTLGLLSLLYITWK